MTEASGERIAMMKAEIRARALDARTHQPNKDALSRTICDKFAALPEYAIAETVMFYVDFRDEVRTRPFLTRALESEKQIVVPYCVGSLLKLFPLEHLDELALGTFGILEPKQSLRAGRNKQIDVDKLDLVMVPGVAFDRRGGRIGHGRGYYDQLLQTAQHETIFIALAFDCQLFPEIPMQPHDVFMHQVLTETETILCNSNRNRE